MPTLSFYMSSSELISSPCDSGDGNRDVHNTSEHNIVGVVRNTHHKLQEEHIPQLLARKHALPGVACNIRIHNRVSMD